MKKITFISLLIGLSLFSARAGGGVPSPVLNPAGLDNNFRNTLWFNSGNTAGLAFRPLAKFNNLNLTYNLEKGEFRPEHKGNSINDISLNTGGSLMLGDFMLWGDFSFRNKFEDGANYNLALYEVSDDMPYYYSDPNVSSWIKQEYELAAKMASPVLWGRMSFGLELQYITRVGAKQKDPRSETFKYNVMLLPSLAVSLGKGHILGVNGLFDNNFERSKPSLNNMMKSQKVIRSKGLGEGINAKVGDNDGVKTLSYKGMKYGGGIQYSYTGNAELLVDIGYIARTVDGFENTKLPIRLGSTKSGDITGDIQFIFGNDKSNKLVLDALYSSTSGFEHVQKLDDTAFRQEWVLVSSNKMTTFTSVDASLAYDHLFGNEETKGYDWKIGAVASFVYDNWQYAAPLSYFTDMSVAAGLEGGKQFKFRKSTLMVGLSASFSKNLSGEYVYGGSRTDSWQVTYYRNYNKYLTSDYVEAAGRVNYTFHAKKVNYYIDVDCGWIKPLSVSSDRLAGRAVFGILF